MSKTEKLNQQIFSDLLNVMGLDVIKKKQIRIKNDSERTIISSIMKSLPRHDTSNVNDVAIELAITWVIRLMFFKVLERKCNESFSFDTYMELDYLFFNTTSTPISERTGKYANMFSHVPFLNSLLFKETALEQNTITIGSLDGDVTYLSDFYRNTLDTITTTDMSWIFERLNGYKDGSFYTPKVITSYMCRETLQRAVVNAINQEYGWNYDTLEQIKGKIQDTEDVLRIINTLTICDPSVGTGNFLVAAINEMLMIKYTLGLLPIYSHIRVEDNEIVIDDNTSVNSEVRRVVFKEKCIIATNSMFGVDINPMSVMICQIRLILELLQSSYYNADGTLPKLPNLDLNIRVGNSLISKYDTKDNMLDTVDNETVITEYKSLMKQYRFAYTNTERCSLLSRISDIKSEITNRLDGNKTQFYL